MGALPGASLSRSPKRVATPRILVVPVLMLQGSDAGEP
jgi:hypothetical protein